MLRGMSAGPDDAPPGAPEARAPSSRPHGWTLGIVLLSLALHAPALTWGFFLDDHGQQLAFESGGFGGAMTPFNVFDFGYAPEPGEPLYEGAVFPWWTSPDWKARFFRPLASLSMWLDARIFGRRAVLHHATSLALYALVLAAAWRLFGRLGLGPRALALALAVFAFEDGSALVVGWLANRNSLLEALFATLAVGLALRASGRLPASPAAGTGPALAAVACGALAVLSKESGLASLGLAGLILWRSHRAPAALALALSLAHVAFLWLADYGVRAAMYPAPWLEGGLGRWLENLGLTLAVQPLAAVSPFPVDLIVFEPGPRRTAIALGTLLTPIVSVAVWRRARTLPCAGWLALWGLAALLPQSFAPASDRLVLVPALAWAPLVGRFLDAELRRPFSVPRARVAAALAAGLLLSAGMLLLRAATTGVLMDRMEQVILEAELEPLTAPPPAPGADTWRDVLVLQYPNAVAGFAGGAAWTFETGDVRTRWSSLQLAGRGLDWSRPGDRTLEFTSLDEPFTGLAFESVFLSSPSSPPVGTRWRTPAFEVEAAAVEQGGPRTLRVAFDRPLSEVHFLTWNGERLARCRPPVPGTTARLPHAQALIDFLP